MSHEAAVSSHYPHGDLTEAIRTSLTKLGKTVDNVTIEDLAPVDDFHIGGRLAGAARFVADRYRNQVTGVDLAESITPEQGIALAMPFDD